MTFSRVISFCYSISLKIHATSSRLPMYISSETDKMFLIKISIE